MSNIVGEAVYKISYDANTGELDSALKTTETKVKKSSESVKQKQKEAFKSVEKGAIVAGAALGVFAKSAIDVGVNFDSAMSKVQAISGATGDDLAKLRDKAKEMGSTTKFTATESAEALTYMAMAGWKTADMLDGLEGIMNLAAASGEDLATTSDIVTDALTAFGYSAKDANHFADVLAKASSNANTNVSMMGETFKYVGAEAGALGYSVEDTALAIGLMANAGIKSSQAGTELNAIFSRLATNTNGARDAIEELGIKFYDANGKARPFAQILDELRVATKDMTDEQKTAFTNTVAGMRAQAGLNAMLNATDADYKKLTESINNADGASKEMADTMLNNTGGAITLLKSKFEGLQLDIAEKLSPALNGLIDGLSGFVGWLAENQWVFPVITAGISAILALGLGMKIASFITTLMTLNPVVLAIIAGVTAIAGVATLIISNWSGICDFFGGIFDFIGGLIGGFAEMVFGVFKSIADLYISVWKGFLDGAKQAWDFITGLFGKLAGFFGSIFSNAWNAVKNVFSVGGKIFAGIVEGIANVFKGVVNAIIRGINTVVAIPFNAINGALNGIRSINILGFQPFTWLPRIGVPQIPYLATGGIVPDTKGGRLIVAGEGGQDEWVVPESKMASLLEQINARGGGGDITVNVYGTFATSTSEQRKVADVIAQRIQEIQKSRLEGANL